MAFNVGAFVAMRLYQEQVQRAKKEMIKNREIQNHNESKSYSCSKCHHNFSSEADSVSACACCEEGEYYWPINRK